MSVVSEREVLRFHATHPGATSAALARTQSYARLHAEARGRVLDLACGDAPMPGAIGLDLSAEELRHAPGPCPGVDEPMRARPRNLVRGRAQALPFAAGSFDTVLCHLAFMLFDELDLVVAELDRVLVSDGRFVAMLGGGPTARGDDAFHRFLAILPQHVRSGTRHGDPRARSEAGWRTLFPDWSIAFERVELVLDGTFDDIWRFLGASYEVAETDGEAIRHALHAACADLGDPIPCRVVTWLASAQKP